jgi:hypothetical protein
VDPVADLVYGIQIIFGVVATREIRIVPPRRYPAIYDVARTADELVGEVTGQSCGWIDRTGS